MLVSPNLVAVLKHGRKLNTRWKKSISDLDFPYFNQVPKTMPPPQQSADQNNPDSHQASLVGEDYAHALGETVDNLERSPEANAENASFVSGKVSPGKGISRRSKRPSALEFEPGDLRSISTTNSHLKEAGDAFKEAGVIRATVDGTPRSQRK
jgi:hypothetical protein